VWFCRGQQKAGIKDELRPAGLKPGLILQIEREHTDPAEGCPVAEQHDQAKSGECASKGGPHAGMECSEGYVVGQEHGDEREQGDCNKAAQREPWPHAQPCQCVERQVDGEEDNAKAPPGHVGDEHSQARRLPGDQPQMREHKQAKRTERRREDKSLRIFVQGVLRCLGRHWRLTFCVQRMICVHPSTKKGPRKRPLLKIAVRGYIAAFRFSSIFSRKPCVVSQL